mmetsp:Transcript_48206/g.153873  ORF Transcript_48206/g.153873 Transcript_48206/m.153873 type:complete len:459 (+) Transcript_48206:75-1451(+)
MGLARPSRPGDAPGPLEPLDGGRGEGEARGALQAVLACGAPLVAAMSLGFTSPALETMAGRAVVGGSAREVPRELVALASPGAASCFSAVINVGALLGAAAGGRLCSALGRRGALQLSAALIAGCWAWAGLAASALQLCMARALMGLGVGLQSVATPGLIAEVAPRRLRGTLGTANAAAVLLGAGLVQLAGGCLRFCRAGPEDEFCRWRRLAGLVGLSALLALAATLLLPPAPGLGFAASPPASPCTPQPGAARRLGPRRLALAGLVPMAWQQLSGINAVVFFGQDILALAGLRSPGVLGPSVFGVQLAGVALAAVTVERLGRRPLLIGSAGGMAAAAGSLALLLRFRTPPWAGVLGSLYAYVFLFSMGLGSVPWLLLPELGLPEAWRLWVASLATATNWACSFLVTATLGTLEAACGLSGAFGTFAALCLSGAALIALLVPETAAGRSRGARQPPTA